MYGGENKNYRRSAMSACLFGRQVGLLVVRLKYCLYVGNLSKWFTFFLVFSCLFVVVVSTFTLAGNVPQLQEVGDFYPKCSYEE